ncbi:MAG: D-arabinono-1,4-lactone oxidase [Chloroflexota bacterium]
MAESRTNWAGNHVIAGRRVHEPRSLPELQEVVSSGQHLRVMGTGHTFNDLPDSRGDLISLSRMPRRFEVGDGTVTVDAAVRYGDLCEPLDRAGFALEALASLGHICVAGASATGTHGSGDRTKCLPAAVAALEIVTAHGELVEVRRSEAGGDLPGIVVALGAAGVVTSVTLDVVPGYEVRQDVYEDIPLDTVLSRFDDITSAADSVSLFTLWQDRRFHQVWCKRRSAEADQAAMVALLGGVPADGPRHPIPGHDPDACTTQMGVPGPWHERLPHFRTDRTPSSGEELQSEYLVHRRDGPAAVAALFESSERFARVVQVSEVRTVAADDLWLSPSTERPSVAIHFTWFPEVGPVLEAVAAVEAVLAPFDPRPHWGKIWTLPVESVRASYPKFEDFRQLCDRWDPQRKFANRYVDALLRR